MLDDFTIAQRVQDIQRDYAAHVAEIIVLRVTEETLKLRLNFENDSSLRVTERWQDGARFRYSYYWLNSRSELIVGWDNVPHHADISTFPHHKHTAQQSTPQPSAESSLGDVIAFIHSKIDKN